MKIINERFIDKFIEKTMRKTIGKILERDKYGQRFWERDILSFFSSKEGGHHAKPAVLATLCHQMAFMLKAGITLKTTMSVLADNPKSYSRRMRFCLSEIGAGIIRGESLSYAMESTGFFPHFMCSMTRIGEMSNNLPQVMELLAGYYEEMSQTRDEIKSALLYPAIVTCMLLAMIIAAVLFVLPNYALVFEISEVPLPVLTQVLLNISDVMITRWWLVMPIITILAATPSIIVRTPKGRNWFEYILLYMPPVSTLYRQMVNLHIVQAMALLLQSRQPLVNAVIAVSAIIPNKRVSRDLQQVALGLQEGMPFWVLLERVPYMDSVVIDMARVGEETGNMEQVFEHASAYSRHQFRQMSKRLNKLVEPVITLVLGLVLGLVMLAIILPTFAMTELMGY